MNVVEVQVKFQKCSQLADAKEVFYQVVGEEEALNVAKLIKAELLRPIVIEHFYVVVTKHHCADFGRAINHSGF